MNEHTCTLPSDIRQHEAVDLPTSEGIVVISVAEVMLGTAAATARPHGALRTWWARLSEIRAERSRITRRRPDYFEHAAMAREMYRL